MHVWHVVFTGVSVLWREHRRDSLYSHHAFSGLCLLWRSKSAACAFIRYWSSSLRTTSTRMWCHTEKVGLTCCRGANVGNGAWGGGRGVASGPPSLLVAHPAAKRSLWLSASFAWRCAWSEWITSCGGQLSGSGRILSLLSGYLKQPEGLDVQSPNFIWSKLALRW